MTMQLLNELVEFAKKATPGEWCTDRRHSVLADAGLNANYYIAACSGPEHLANTNFIAAANPAAILAIAEYVKGLEAELADRNISEASELRRRRQYAGALRLRAEVAEAMLESHIADAGKMIPKGWRLMPDEPTAEMMKAMYQAQDMWPNAHCDNQREREMSFARPRYIAAIATAPEAPHD